MSDGNNDEMLSAYRFFSMGIVAVTKPDGTDKIEVWPVEHFTFVNGSIADAESSLDIDLPDHKGVKRQDNLKGKPTIIATWAPFSEGNRTTSPDVVANETVMILRYADTQDYYWVTMMREPSLRRKETVMYSYCNIPSGRVAFDKDTSYWALWDTKNQKVQFHTSNNDGEPFKFDLTIDAGQGNVQLADDVGNFLLFDPKNNLFTLNSIAGASISLDNGHIKGHGITIALEADESISLKAGSSISLEAPDITQNGSSSVAIKTSQFGLAADSSSMKAGNIEMEGNTTQKGDYTAQGNVKLEGGDITMTGGSITANGEDLTVDKT